MKRFQRNPHQLDTLTNSASSVLHGIPEISIGESALSAASKEGQIALSSSSSEPASTSGSDIIQITLHDRMAFASRFLSDDAFVNFVIRIRQECLEGGRVDGLLITGLTPMGAWLVQRYLDNTGDCQTAAIVGCFMLRAIQLNLIHQVEGGRCRSAPFADAQSPMVSESMPVSTTSSSTPSLPPWQLSDDVRRMGMLAWRWISAYREILTHHELWNERAMFDVQVISFSTVYFPPCSNLIEYKTLRVHIVTALSPSVFVCSEPSCWHSDLKEALRQLKPLSYAPVQ